MAKIVHQVFVYDKEVVAIAVHGDFGIVLNSGGETVPKEVIGEIYRVIRKGENTNNSVLTHLGSDGVRTRAGYPFLLPKSDYRQAILQLLPPTILGGGWAAA